MHVIENQYFVYVLLILTVVFFILSLGIKLKEINKISLNLSEEILKKLSNKKKIKKNTLKHLIKKNLKEVD